MGSSPVASNSSVITSTDSPRHHIRTAGHFTGHRDLSILTAGRKDTSTVRSTVTIGQGEICQQMSAGHEGKLRSTSEHGGHDWNMSEGCRIQMSRTTVESGGHIGHSTVQDTDMSEGRRYEGHTEQDMDLTSSSGPLENEIQSTANDNSELAYTSQSAVNRAPELLMDANKVLILLSQLAKCSWWDWEGGSSLIYWRWGDQQAIARDGMTPFISRTLPTIKKRARRPKSDKFELVAEKLKAIVEKFYVQPGLVRCLTDYFDVPKGDDIRMVYNGSSCGVNQATWAPSFWLPFPRSAVRLLDYNYYSVDMDLGEMFLNFPLHYSMQAYAGIDLTHF
jgi:hypothetical protein